MTKFQVGKSGITQGVIDSLVLCFKKNKTVRVSVLKSCERDKKKIREMADELCSRLPGNYKYILIGFTIILKKNS